MFVFVGFCGLLLLVRWFGYLFGFCFDYLCVVFLTGVCVLVIFG